MKTLRLSICILLLSINACSQKEDYPTLDNLSSLEELKLLAQKNGYTDLIVNMSRPLIQGEVQLCKKLINKKVSTRGYIQVYKYITEISGGFLQFDYSRNSETKEIIEAYGGVYSQMSGSNPYPDKYPGEYVTLHTLYSRPEFMNNTRFDLIIKAARLTSKGGPYSSSSAYNKHYYRLVIAAGLNVDTQIHNITIHEQGEGEWPAEP